MTQARRPASTIQAVLTNLREKISLQSILPGARLTEEELVDNYSIPRAMAREVLAVLEDRGIVRRIPNKGAVVAHVDMQWVYHYYDAREALDGMMVRLAARQTRPKTGRTWSSSSASLSRRRWKRGTWIGSFP